MFTKMTKISQMVLLRQTKWSPELKIYKKNPFNPFTAHIEVHTIACQKNIFSTAENT